MSAGNAPTATTTAVGAHLEALNLAGVSFAARRLLGKDPMAVTGQFAMWARSGTPGLPSLTEPLWKALAPLGIGRPSSPNAAVCDMVLVGREPDAAIARQAAVDGAAEGKTLFGRAPLPDDADARQLVGAVKAYWRTLGGAYDEVRGQVVDGDQPGAIAAMRGHAPALRSQLKEVTRLAASIAARRARDAAAGIVPRDPHEVVVTTGGLPQASTEPSAPAEPPASAAAVRSDAEPVEPPRAGQMDAAATPVRSTIEPVPSGSLKLTDEQAEAFARGEVLSAHAEEQPAVRKVEVLSDKPVRNHPYLPILFLAIINDPANPLLQ